MRKVTLFAIGVVVVAAGLLALRHFTGKATSQQKPVNSNATVAAGSPSASSSASATPDQVQSNLLQLPIDPKWYSPRSFGTYPFGAKSAEHPEGHAGINFEVKKDTEVVAPIAVKILSVKPPPGRPDEFNVVADAGDYRVEVLRLGKLGPGVVANTEAKSGQVIGYPGLNTASGVYQFHFGVTDQSGDALCPEQKYWSQRAWNELQVMLQSSSNHQLCVDNKPILYSKRSFE